MKKSVFTLAIVAFCLSTGMAQGFKACIKAGVNVANQKISVEGFGISVDPRTSVHAGVYGVFAFSEFLSLQPELLYSSVGAKMNILGIKASSRLNYLSLPIMLRYNPQPIFNLHAGPQIGFLVSAKEELEGLSEDAMDAYKQLDVGLGIGAGVELPIGIGFSARYVLGIANIADMSDADEIDGKFTNNVFQISVNYKIFGD